MTIDSVAYKRRWFALALLSMSLLLIVIDSTIVNIAFPSIRSTFNASFADAEWVNSIYSLIFGAALITWGKLGDQYGRRFIFIGGVIVFAVGSLGMGVSPTIGSAIFFRAMQGMGGAMLSPSTLSIISSTFKGKERGIAFGLWGATAGVGAALGPILGGWLIEYGGNILAESWRLAFLINVPIAVIAIAGSFYAIRETRDKTIKHRIDVLGIILATLSIGSIVFGAIEGQNYGWLEAKKVFSLGPLTYPQLPAGTTAIPAGTLSFIPFAFLLGVLLFIVFIFVERRQERNGGEPLFEFGMLKYRSFRFGLMTVLIVALGEFGVILVISIYFQLAKGIGAFETGLNLLPLAVAILFAAPMAGALSTRFGAKWVVTAGMLCEATALFWLSRLFYADTPISTFIPPFLLYGAGIGLAIAQLTNLVLSDIPMEKVGVGSGANNTVRQLGASLGIAIIGAVLFGNFTSLATPLVQNSTAFEDFGTRVAANTGISHEAQVFGSQIASFGQTAKDKIITALDNNEGFDGNTDVVQSALDNMPSVGKLALRIQGVNLDDPATVTKIKQDLAPDATRLTADIQEALAEGFSAAGRLATLVASIFVACGAISSLMLPQTRHGQQLNAEALPAH
jgi:MFS family permease